MAVRRSPARRVSEDMVVEPMPVEERYSRPVNNKSLMEKLAPIMFVILLLMAFALGSMWSKLKYLEQGGTGTNVVAGGTQGAAKLDELFRKYAKEVGIDQRKFEACYKDGSKKDLVTADTTEGNGYGVQGTPGFFINGIFLNGAFPYEAFKEIIDMELAGRSTADVTKYSKLLQDAGSAFNPVKKNISLGSSAVKGPENAQITIVEYSDFQCPFCSRALPTLDKIMTDYSGKVKLVYKHYPLTSIHPNAEEAAWASECARDQGKFWEMHDKLFQTQQEWSLAS